MNYAIFNRRLYEESHVDRGANEEVRTFLFFPGSIYGMDREDDTPIRVATRKGIDGVLFHAGTITPFATTGFTPMPSMGKEERKALEYLMRRGLTDPRYIEEVIHANSIRSFTEWANRVGPGEWEVVDQEDKVIMTETLAQTLPTETVLSIICKAGNTVSNPSAYQEWIEWRTKIDEQSNE